MKWHRRVLVAALSLMAGYVAAALIVVHTARVVPRPAAADSLAGVVARLTFSDSSRISRIVWKVTDWPFVAIAASRSFAYREGPSSGLLGLDLAVARTLDGKDGAVTVLFATSPRYGPWDTDEEVIKHELVHALTGIMDHPRNVFATVEGYHGR